MHRWLKLADRIDALSAAVGRALRWAILVSVGLAAFSALSRKLFLYYSNSWSELQWYLFGAAFLFCAADVLRVDEHVRVDALSRRWSDRTRAWIDLVALAVIAIFGFLWLTSARKGAALIGIGAAMLIVVLFASEAYFNRMRKITYYEYEG